MLLFENINAPLDEVREEAQAIILNDLWLYTTIPKDTIDCDDPFVWLFILFGLFFKNGINTLLSEYQYLNPLF